MMKQAICMSLGLLVLLAASCVDTLEEKTGKVPEGIPVVARFSYKVAASQQIDTRLAQEESVENRVVQLFAIAFDQNGVRSGAAEVTVDLTNKQFSLPMNSGANKTLYLIANYDKGTGNLVDEEGNVVNLNEIYTLEDFKKVGFEHDQTNWNQVDRSLFLMVGKIEGFSVSATGAVSGAETVELERISARINFNIKAESVEGGTLTDITFDPYYYYVDNIPHGSYLDLQETDWKAGMKDNYTSMAGTDHRHLDSSDPDGTSKFTFYLMENRQAPRRSITLADKPADATLYSLREKRDRGADADNGNGQEYEQGPFTYAPQYGTYVVIYGRVQGQQTQQGDNPGSDVIADAFFIVHLGETGNGGDDETLVNNYNTRRNVQYTYNITITGVHSMHVEVENDNEIRPGVEGDLIMTGDGAFFDLDAHFNTAVFKVDLSQWSENQNPPVSWAYSTPFGREMKVLNREAFNEDGTVKVGQESQLQTSLANNDYKWIQFAINKECGVSSAEVVPYPGENAYTGSSNNESGPAPVFGGNGYNGKKLYDVNQLMNRLYQIYRNGTLKDQYMEEDGTVVVTAYIDEFLYTYDPTEYYYKAPGRTTNIDQTLWKRSINENPRWLYLSTDSEFSPDGETTRAKAIVVFSQRPIYTIYNASKVNTAWGTESIVEDTKFRTSGYSLKGQLSPDVMTAAEFNRYPNNRLNGYENTVYWLTEKTQSQRWDTYVDYTQGLSDNEKFKLASAMKGSSLQASVLIRNRDFDGDGIIDAGELKWYLGAFGQLQGMIIGKNSLPRAQLYDESLYVTSEKVTPVHIASSTYIQNGDYYPIKVWGEQEGANGASNQQGAENGIGNSTGDYYMYRCMRNLGTESTEEPEEYIKLGTYWPGIDGDYSKEAVFDLRKIDINSLRSPFLNTLLPDGLHERDLYGNSRPSSLFSVLQRKKEDGDRAEWIWRESSYPYTSTSTNYLSTLNDIIWREGTASYECPSGYRLPNHAELLIMQIYSADARIINEHWDRDEIFRFTTEEEESYVYVAKNLFSYAGTDPYWVGRSYVSFVIKEGNVSLASAGIGGGLGLKVRCVRDLTESDLSKVYWAE